ncbi:MAG: hypothetical protein C4547_01470 [Phycisphaerales bacterium]|nr:MAG: hypothetical protein C4547_01470 [Phycisphaerales bacterium]
MANVNRRRLARIAARRLAPTVLILGACCVPTAFASEDLPPTAYEFRQLYPGSSFYVGAGRIGRVYGAPFGFGTSPQDAADTFVAAHAEMFGVTADDLRPIGPTGRATQDVMYDADSETYKFTLVYYSQFKDGVPVFRADLRILSRNVNGFPLVLAASSLRDLGDFAIPVDDGKEAFAPAATQITSLHPALVNFSQPETVIWAGIDDVQVTPRLAWQVIGDDGQDPTENRWLFLVDALNGQVLYEESLIYYTDVTGNVSGNATQGFGADECAEEAAAGLPYARVSIDGGNVAIADVNGDFIIPHGGNSPVTVHSEVAGRYFRTVPQQGGNDALVLVVTPPGPADFLHNAANNSEFVRALTNTYLHANLVRDFILVQNPDYPTIASQTNYTINVNLNQTCNAFYNGGSINFFASGGNCNNTGFSSVVYHEYGHHLVATGGSGQGQYGEGMGDVLAMLMADDPRLGIGFRVGQCNNGIRDARSDIQYPCSGEVHACGVLLSACVWGTREELIITEPDDYLEILSNLAVNAVLVHRGNSITPQITIDYLVLDDDDGNLENGTPHYREIAKGFGAHNMDAPRVSLLGFSYPDGRPNSLTPDTPTTFDVRIEDLAAVLDPDTPRIHYAIDGDPFESAALANLGGRLYEATIPPVECGKTVAYYLSAETDQGDLVTDPADAPDTAFEAAAGLFEVFADNFETDKGWSVANENITDGAWERGVPIGGGVRGDPPTDYDGSGQCYLTANRPGNSDVDDGTTHLISPRLDLSSGDAVISYARWYSNNFGNAPNQDIFTVAVSNNDGNSWTTAEIVGPGGQEAGGGWFTHSFRVGEFVTPTDQVRVRFTASDLGEGSVVEAAVDKFAVEQFICEGEPIRCEEIKKFTGKCKRGGKVKGKLVLTNSSHQGQSITVSIDGSPVKATIRGKTAKFSECCWQGFIEIRLIDPPDCVPPIPANCP